MSEPVRSVDGLVSCFGAGLFLGLAPAASLAGWWLLGGLVLAAGLAVLFALSTSEPRPGRDAGRGRRSGVRGRVVAACLCAAPFAGTLGRLAAAVAIAGTFGAYLLPDRPSVAGVGLVVVVAVAVVLGVRPPAVVNRVAAGVVIAVLVVVATACFAIAPVAQPGGTGSPVGALPAAALLFVCFTGETGGSRRQRVVVVGVVFAVCLMVAAGALRQLGAARLALSPAPLRDVLAAADAVALTGLLAIGVTVACAGALFWALRGLDRRFVAPAGVLVALGALLVDPVVALVVAAVLLITGSGFGIVGRQSVG